MYRLTRLSLSHPKLTLLVLALVTAVLAGGLLRLRTEFGYRVLIGQSHPLIRALDGFIERFGGGIPIQIAWECGEGRPCASVFDRESLEMAHAVTQALAPVAGIQNVQGPANAALLVPDADGFAIRRFVENGELVPDAEALSARALDDPLWVGTLVSADGRVGVIVLQSRDTNSETHLSVVEAIEEILAPFGARGFEYHLAGEAVSTVVAGRDLAESMASLIPPTVLVIALVLLFLSRSWQSVAVSLGTMGLALLWTLGLLGWLDWPRDGILQVLAPLILVVGVCDAIHLLSRYASELDARGGARSAGERVDALLKVAGDVGPPCLITTLTTAGAFLSFTTSALDTFVRFGAISAFGVSACLVLTFTLLPVLVRMLPSSGARAARASGTWDVALDAIVRTSEKRTVPILLTTVVLFVICGIGWAVYLRVDTDWYETWGERSQVVRDIRFLEDRLGPSLTLEIELGLPPEAALEDPATLRTVSEFSEFLPTVDGLDSTTSILDLMERLNRVLHDDDPAFERLGDTTAANAEIFELLSFDDSRVLASWLSLDRSKLRISAEAAQQSYLSRGKVLDSVRDYVQSELPPGWNVLLSGPVAMGFHWIRDVQSTQLRSFPTALALVLVMVAIFLGSVRLSLAAMVPTLLPVVVTLGAMGWVGLSLDVGRAMIAAVLIGIAVDDSIHVLSQYKRRRAGGDDPRQAIRGALLHAGRAVVTTSLALSLGFLTLMLSTWQTISSFGFFVSLAILGALAAALFVLPALIFAFGPRDQRIDLDAPAEEQPRGFRCTG